MHTSRPLPVSLERGMRAAHRALAWLEAIGLAAAAACVLGTMFVTAIDVGFRYAIGTPLSWWYDLLMNYVLLAIFYLAFSYTLAHHGHLAVEYFAHRLPRRLCQGLVALALVASSAVFYTVFQGVGLEAWHAWLHDDVMAGAILWPVWISKLIVAIGVALLALRSLHLGICHALAVRHLGAFEAIGLRERLTEMEEVTS